MSTDGKRKHGEDDLYNKRLELIKENFGYTNDDNPFGDSTLVEPFIWEKKLKTTSNSSIADIVQSKVDEIKSIKSRREQYEYEKSLLEDYRLQVQKDRNDVDYIEWENKENEFILGQIISKTTTRLKDGREKLIDKLISSILNVNKSTEYFNSKINVLNILKDVNKGDLEELLEISDAYLKLNPESNLSTYWNDINVINLLNFNYALHDVSQVVGEKIDSVLMKKTINELDAYEVEINKRLNSDDIIDTNFWETTLGRIPFFKACRSINDYLNNNNTNTEELVEKTLEIDMKPSKIIIEKDEDELSYEKFIKFTKLEEDEEIFTDYVKLKYSGIGIEPRYYNRIKKGFEWNKYNQTHYDTDNLPPKHVQGYKFNIFYPKIKNNIPKWKLEKDGNTNDTAIIRFIGGPPYKDIAFRIVNKEWNTDPIKGFKNCFDNGVLHLYFDFKKIKYRR